MSKSTNVSIDAEIQAKAQIMLYEGGIPFSITGEVPNKVTLEAMKEIDDMREHPEQYKRYSSFSELLKEVEDDD